MSCAITVKFEGVPDDVRKRDQWVLWQNVERGGRETKMPVSVYGGAASSTDPTTWTSFDMVTQTYNEAQHAGIGFVFGTEDEFFGIDLDGCRNPADGTLASWAEKIVHDFDTYSEVSPSGTGVKVFCRSDQQLPAGKRKLLNVAAVSDKAPGIEVYSQGRYFTVTGQAVNDCCVVRDCTRQLSQMLELHWPFAPATAERHDWRSDDAVVDRARKYVAKMPSAISGQRGHDQTFSVACSLMLGFDLTKSQAMDVLAEYNERCEPPWSEHELQHKIKDASKQSGERGYLRSAKPERYSSLERQHRVPADDKPARTFAGVDVADHWHLIREPVEWIVEDVFASGQPTIVGAKQKSLKTTLMADLCVALATGRSWLGNFTVPLQRRVLLITGEASLKSALKKLGKAAGPGCGPEQLKHWIRVEAANFPTLPRQEDCDAVAAAIVEHDIDVLILDPLYMGLEGLNTANLTEVGPAMRRFMAACRPAEVVICHHVKKTASFDDAPNLEDLSQAGIAEFAGNYWLMGRMGEYQGEGIHNIAIRAGGRDDQFHLLQMNFNEILWQADFVDLQEHREKRIADRQTKKHEAEAKIHHAKVERARARITSIMRNHKTPRSKRNIEDLRGEVPQLAFREAFADMVTEKTIAIHPYRDVQGRLVQGGYLLAEYGDEYEKGFAKSEAARHESATTDTKQEDGKPNECEEPAEDTR
ncbi:MAG: AAA family ATPase [Pirellulaceae bacterium]|nr:AAA family ATPase [Pirellulaceae bacterium]